VTAHAKLQGNAVRPLALGVKVLDLQLRVARKRRPRDAATTDHQTAFSSSRNWQSPTRKYRNGDVMAYVTVALCSSCAGGSTRTEQHTSRCGNGRNTGQDST
jgi:hypothetical protein